MVKIIENYCLNEPIGEGEYGKVFKGNNLTTKQEVAIKVIRADKFKQLPKLQQCTINEIDTLSKVEHNPHIVKFIQILKTANNYYFVYQFCNNGTLEKLIAREGPLPDRRALGLFKNLLTAFRSLHSLNIMHRDLKPGNILFHNNVLKLADFGFCKSLQSSKDLTQTMLGSPIYMAPEVLKGQIYTIKADIWSLGVVLYEMLFGFCPFEESSIAKLICLLEEAPVRIPREINPILKTTEQLLLKMLVKDHFKRCSWEDLFQLDITDEGEIRQKKEQKPVSPPESQSLLSKRLSPLREVNILLNESQRPAPTFKKGSREPRVNTLGSVPYTKPAVSSPSVNSSMASILPPQQIAALHGRCLLMAKRLHTLSWCYHPNPGPYIQLLMNKLLDSTLKLKAVVDSQPHRDKIREIVEAEQKALREGGALQITPSPNQWSWVKDYISELKGFQSNSFGSLDQQGRQIVLHAAELLEMALSEKRSQDVSKDKSKASKAQLSQWIETMILQL